VIAEPDVMRARKILGASSAALVLGAAIIYQLGACSGPGLGPDSQLSAPAQPPRPQHSAEARALEVERYFSAVATVTARERSHVAARLQGLVEEVTVEEGDVVREGDVLVRIEAEATGARVGQARKQLDAAKARRRVAQKRYERSLSLVGAEAISETEHDGVVANWKAAEAEVGRARQALREARAVRSRTLVRAPVDGQVARRSVDPGDLARPGRPLLILQTARSLELTAFVREGLAHSLATGEPLRVEIPSVDFVGEGTLESIVPSVDPNSRAFEVKVSLPDLDRVTPGMFARLQVPAGKARTVVVPENAIRRVGQLDLVRARYEGSGWHRRYVTTGRTTSDGVEILSGLRGGERVALWPAAGSADGADG
jgi:RND family efflux transporter MFP subunit